MKKVLFLMISVLALGLVFAGCGDIANITAPESTTEGVASLSRATQEEPEVFVLYAGQNEKVGTVEVWNDENNVYVEYDVTESDWCITETHIHVGESLDNFPLTKKGNPQVGLFTYSKDDHNCVNNYTETIPLGEWEDVYIAAHAVVRNTKEILNETLYLADSGSTGTDLFSVELNEDADLTRLINLPASEGFDQVDAIACTPDG
ncbi:MAG: hypothetical protein R6V04_00880, partial [bacterium]